MSTVQFTDSVSLILNNQKLLPQPKFNICDWVTWSHTPVQYRDFGIVTGYFYETTGAEEITITYRIVLDKKSPSYYQDIIDCDFALENELEKLDEVSIAQIKATK